MVLERESKSWGFWCTFTCGFVSKFPEMISLNFGGFPQLTLIPKKPDAGLWLVEALAWYKDAFEHGAEHLSSLTKDLPVGGWIDLGEEVSPLHQEPLVPGSFIPPRGGGSACSAPCLEANQGGSQGCSSQENTHMAQAGSITSHR